MVKSRIFLLASHTCTNMASDRFIKVPKIFLILGGFWPFAVTSHPLKAKLYKLYSRFQTYSYVTLIASLVLKLALLVIRKEDETIIFRSVNVLVLVFETCVKILIFQVMRIPHMFAHAMKHEQDLLKSGDLEVITTYGEQVKYARRVNLSQFFFTTFAISTFTVTALFDVFLTPDIVAKYEKEPFMHDLWFPFRRETHMPWVIFFNMLMTVQGLCFNTATQATLINLMIYSSARFKLLGIKLNKFDVIAYKNGHDIWDTVRDLIREHQDLLSFVESLNVRIRYVLLMEFILNEFGLASGIIQILMVDTVTYMMSIVSIIILQLFQIFVMAWTANEITIQGSKIADSIMSSNWVEQSINVQKLFLVMVMRAQRPLGLTAGPFFNMNAGTAVSTVKAAYTYLTFMMRDYN